MSPAVKGSCCILLGAMLLGTLGTAQALAPTGANPLSVGPIRLLGGGVLLLLWEIGRRGPSSLAGWDLRRLLLAAVGLAGYQIFFFKGCAAAGVAVSTVVAVGSIPITAGILGFFILGERPGPIWGLATVVAVVGLVFLTLTSSRDAVHFSGLGVLLAVLAACSYAVYLVSVKPLVQAHDPTQILTFVLLLGGLMLLPLMLAQPLAWVCSLRGALVVGNLALLTCALALSLDPARSEWTFG